MNIQEHISLKELTTMKIGGVARFFCMVTSEADMREAFAFAKEKGIVVTILGGGSNVLVGSDEIHALVIKVDVRGVEWKDEGDTVLVIGGAGQSWDALVAEAVRRELWGIENLSGIPGTVGAAPIQNIGAYGTEVKEVIEWVEVFDIALGKLRQLTNAECRFAYRDSIFKHEGKKLMVTKVAVRLKKAGVPNLEYKDLKRYFAHDPAPSLVRIRATVLEIRSKKFPDLNEFGTAGSFFKNPIIPKAQFDELQKKYPDLPGFPMDADIRGFGNTRMLADDSLRIKDKGLRIKIPLAWILDNICGLKGYEKGNVKLFEKQPIVLVQNGSASAEEIESFAKEISDRVREQTGIIVEWEVQKIF